MRRIWLSVDSFPGRMAQIDGDVRLGNESEDPTFGMAGLDFLYGTDQARDQISLYCQGRLLEAMLVITTTPSHFCVSRL